MGRQQRYRSISGGSVSEMTPTKSTSHTSSSPFLQKQQQPPSQKALTATREVFHLLMRLRDSTGKNFLHCAAADTNRAATATTGTLGLAQALLQRATQLDQILAISPTTTTTTGNKKDNRATSSKDGSLSFKSEHATATCTSTGFLERLLSSRDTENQYTPLHWAMLERNLAAVLLLLRHFEGKDHGNDGSSQRLVQRPMHLLQAKGRGGIVKQNNTTVQSMVSLVDGEGLTPLELLCRVQEKELSRCFHSLPVNNLSSLIDDTRDTNSYSSKMAAAFHLDNDEDLASLRVDQTNELDALAQETRTADQQEQYQQRPSILPTTTHGCEVLTFGRANHCALGVGSGGGKGSGGGERNGAEVGGVVGEVRPQRVQTFALSDLGKDQSAVAIAAAAHHTLVATRHGHLYSFGLGKGGRLGTGDERHRPLPTRILGSLGKRRVVAVAAAENHSLCVTSDGGVYSWGSNRFGQLGSCNNEEKNPHTGGTNGRDSGSGNVYHKNTPDSFQRCLPRRVNNLKHVFCVSVAAGDRHSVALSNRGEVYAWGDNTGGQLGIAIRKSGNSSSTSAQQVNRVDALWAASPRRVAIGIAAAEQSTLVLTRPGASLPTNMVYSWGHGNHVPIKVNFSVEKGKSSGNTGEGEGDGGYANLMRTDHINPVAIACAKYHNAAITADGRVFTWGLHMEPLGTVNKTKQKSRSMVIPSPQLVTGMLPENGGGTAVAVSVSENHTAVLTSCGNLYTLGATCGKDVLGHEGLRWQPSPKKVPGVYRAVSVSAAKEHTVLLIGTSFPDMIDDDSSNNNTGNVKLARCDPLEISAAKTAARHVDLFNVIPVSVIAERNNASFLSGYCREFIRLNLDGVLTLGKKSEMDRYLNDQLTDGVRSWIREDRDMKYHPLIFDVVGSDCNRSLGAKDTFSISAWIELCERLVSQMPAILLSKHRAAYLRREQHSESAIGKSRRDRALRFHGVKNDGEKKTTEDVQAFDSSSCECSERCMLLTANMNLTTDNDIRSKFDCLSKEVRSARKRLAQISKLEQGGFSSLTEEQTEKVSRRPLLQVDLRILHKALQQVEDKMLFLNMSSMKEQLQVDKDIFEATGESIPSVSKDEKTRTNEDALLPTTAVSKSLFRCSVCQISCPDANSFELHKTGRKHRNMVSKADEKEEKEAAASMMEMKRRQQGIPTRNQSKSAPNHWQRKELMEKYPGVQPKYKLPPPPAFPSPIVSTPVIPKITLKMATPGILPSFTKRTGAKKNLSFSKILEEEAKRTKLAQMKPAKATASESFNPIKAAPWMKNMKAVARLPKMSAITTDSLAFSPIEPLSKKTYSLGDFFVSPASAQKPVLKSGWTTPQSNRCSKTPTSGFLDIQQEEEVFRTKQDKPCEVEGRWYIERRERAGSMSKIQEEEATEREMKLLVAEQKKIEKQIMRERNQKEIRTRKDQKNQPTLEVNESKRKGRQKNQNDNKRCDGNIRSGTAKKKAQDRKRSNKNIAPIK